MSDRQSASFHSYSRKPPMSKRAPKVEWEIAQDDADWERLCAPPHPATQGRLSSKHFLGGVALLFFLLVCAGGWGWRPERATLPPSEVDVPATVQHELEAVLRHGDPASLYWEYQFAWQEHGLHAAIPTVYPDAHLELVIDTLELQGEQAVARIVTTTQGGVPAYRQTRFYRRIGPDWVQTAPNADLWGPERSLETPSFIFQFRQH